MSGFKVNVNFGSDTFVAKPNFDIRGKTNLKNIEFFENGIYKPEGYGADGFGEVNVDVQPTLEELTITANGTYTPQEGVDGFSKVTAEFDTKVKVSAIGVNQGCVTGDGEWESAKFIDTSEVTSLANLFWEKPYVKKVDVSSWNTSKVTSMSGTFGGNSAMQFSNLDVTNWDTSNVTTLRLIFKNCRNIRTLDLTNWIASKVTDAGEMFVSNSALSSIVGDRSIDDVVNNNICVLKGLNVAPSRLSKGHVDNLDRASLRALINGLADRTGQTTLTLDFSDTLMAKLTEEDIAIAVNKNWTIT